MNAQRRKLLRGAIWLSVLSALAGGSVFAYKRYGVRGAAAEIPSAVAKQGEFLVIVPCRGELVAGRSVQITAPVNVPDLRIVWQAPQGGPIKAGEPVVRFDASGAKRQLQEKEAALRQSEATLDQAIAQTKIQAEQDKLEYAWQRHTVERAKLEVSKAEIVSKIQAEESRIDLGIAQEKLKVQQATMDLNAASGQSKIASLKAQRDKNKAEVDLTLQRLSQMEVKAPAGGVVNFLMNYSQGWMNAKPFKVGDTVWPGSAIAEVPDLTSLQLKAKLEEIERGRIQSKQAVRIHMDPFPEKPFPGMLESVSPLAEQNFEWPPSRNFRAFASFQSIDPRLRPGMNGRLDIVVDRIPNAVSVPAKAVFARQGKAVVIVAGPEGEHPVPVEILARNPDEVAVKGIAASTRVALVDNSPERRTATP
ncbi:MAG: efflux RND transporter periplasmic adaptor subunit [Bryobacteraceae bacterium]